MPQTVIISGLAFQIQSAVQGSDGVTFLLSFTQPPNAVNPAGATDALNPANYVIVGPTSTSVGSVTQLNSFTFALHLTAAVITGDYTLTVNNVQSGGSGLSGSNSIVIHCVVSNAKESLVQGRENDDADNLIRRFINPQFRNQPAWEALIHGLAAGDGITKANTFLAFLQLFLSSASGDFLIQRAADEGIDHPDNVGMSDDLFRQLAIAVTNNKLVHEALLEILEVFYGDLATRANIISANSEPFSFTAGDTLSFLFDDRQAVTVTFNPADFSALAAAKASEVAAMLTRAFQAAGIHAYATVQTVNGLNKVAIFSGALGLLGSIVVTGGMADNSLVYPTNFPLFTGPTTTTWGASRISAQEYRLTYTGSTAPNNLLNIQPGDFVNLNFVNTPALRGSYVVSVVHFSADVITGSLVNNVWFSIVPQPGFPYPVGSPPITITQTGPQEVQFYRPTRTTVIQNANPSFIAQYEPGQLDVILPATTQAVFRTAQTAAYLSEQPVLGITTTTRTSNISTVNTTAPHGLQIGQMVQLRSVTAGSIGRWNSLGQVTNIVNPTRFQMNDVGPDGTGSGGEVNILTASLSASIQGPYLADPNHGFAITAISTSSTTAIAGGRGISTLSVVSTSGFPTTAGWLVFGFGTQYETGPIPYLGKLDATTILVDKSFIIPKDIPSGFDVMLLAQKGPFDPTNSKANLVWITDSNSGRVAAEQFVADSGAAGVQLNFKITYPGDRGLGGEGQPVTGQKLSDKVEVWAGDNVDAEIASAHNA